MRVKDEEQYDAGLASVYAHNKATHHPLTFYISNMRLEYICSTCGEVLYEGPVFEDGVPGFERWRAPTSH